MYYVRYDLADDDEEREQLIRDLSEDTVPVATSDRSARRAWIAAAELA